jgi:hypothetical protein
MKGFGNEKARPKHHEKLQTSFFSFIESGPGLPDGTFSYPNPKFWYFLEGFDKDFLHLL